MNYRGHVKDGLVVLDTPGLLPEGAEVRIEVLSSEKEGPLLDEKGETLGDKLMKFAGRAVGLLSSEKEGPLLDEKGETLGDKLMKFAGRAVGLPEDAAVNHDHYLYGTRCRIFDF